MLQHCAGLSRADSLQWVTGVHNLHLSYNKIISFFYHDRRPKLSSSMSSNHHHFQNEISMQLNTCFWLKGQDSYSWSFNTLYMQKRITSFKPKTRSHPSAAGLQDCFDIPQTYLFTYDLFTNCKLPPKKLLIGGSSANQENKGLPSTFQSGPAMLSQALLCDVATVKRSWS